MSILHQYAISVIGYSSQYSSPEWSANQVIGTPNVNEYGDIPEAWTTSSTNMGIQSISVGFATPVYSTGAMVRENCGNGFVTRIDAIDINGQYHTVWSGTDSSIPGSVVNAVFAWSETTYLVTGLRVYIDTDHTDSWEEIDAIQLRGVINSNSNSNPTGSVEISGTATQAQILTASNNLADVDGLGTIGYQWQVSSNGSSNWTNISAATANSYTLRATEVNRYVRVVASYTDGHGTQESVFSGTTALYGGEGGSTLYGLSNNNILIGGAGNDTLNGGAGADLMRGGTGNDIYIVDNTGDLIIEAAGTDEVNSSVSYTLGANLENLTLTGTGNLNGTGNDLANIITGNAGNNILNGGAGNDTLNGGSGTDQMIGGTGNDTYVVDNPGDLITEAASAGTDAVNSSVGYTLGANLENLTLTGTGSINGTGNSVANIIIGNAGNNILNGGVGVDQLRGGIGNDIYVVDNIGDLITEAASAGTDAVNSSVSYILSTNLENLTLTGADDIDGTGNELVNVLTGNAGNNILDGETGADQLRGGAGNDSYFVDNTGDLITEAAGAGTDGVYSSVSYTLGANLENLILTGTGNLNGTGNNLANMIIGNAGNNTLNGGAGNDILIGSSGADVFRFVLTTDGTDRIIDFQSGADRIQVVSPNFGNIPVGTLAAVRLQAAGTVLTNGNAVFIYNATTGGLAFDRDGNGRGAAVQIATLTGHPTLRATDFQVVAA